MKELETIKVALDKATQKGAFTLEETALIIQAINSVAQKLHQLEQEELAKKETVKEK